MLQQQTTASTLNKHSSVLELQFRQRLRSDSRVRRFGLLREMSHGHQPQRWAATTRPPPTSASQQSQVKQQAEQWAMTADQHRDADRVGSLTYSCLLFLHQIWKRCDNPRSRLDSCVHCYAFFHTWDTTLFPLSTSLSSTSLSLSGQWQQHALSSPPPRISPPPLPPSLSLC